MAGWDDIPSAQPQKTAWDDIPNVETGDSNITHTPADDRTWYHKAISNLPESTASYIGSTLKALVNPYEASQGFTAMAADPSLRGVVYDRIKDTVSDPEALSNFIAENPAEALSLLSLPITGAGGVTKAVGKLANLPRVAKAGGMIAGAGQMTDPMTASIRAGEGVAQIARRGAQEVAGGISGLGIETARAAAKFSPEFRATQKGEVTGGEIVKRSRSAVESVHDAMNQEFGDYVKSFQAVPGAPTLDVTRPVAAFDKILADRGIRRMTTIYGEDVLTFSRTRLQHNPTAQDDIKKVDNILKTATADPGFYSTPEGMHMLKQELYDHMKTFKRDTKTSSIAQGVWASIRKELGDKVPGYNDMNRKYERISDLVDEVQGAVTGNDKTLVNTSLNKLHNMMKEDLDFRRMIVSEIESKTGENIKDLVAGYMSRGWMPQSYIGKQVGYGAAFGIGSLAAVTANPIIALIGAGGLAMASPKIMSKIMHTLGTTSRSYEYIRKSGIGYPMRQGALRGGEFNQMQGARGTEIQGYQEE